MSKTKVALTFIALLAVVIVTALIARFVLDDEPSFKIFDPAARAHHRQQPGFLYGRVTTFGGASHEGRLRFGGGEETFWGHYFNGSKKGNRWLELVPKEEMEGGEPVKIFGVRVARRDRKVDLDRPFMARLGDVASIETSDGRSLFVRLKSGTEVELERFAADDFADGIRVFDSTHGVVDLGERQIRRIELLAPPAGSTGPTPLYGTVRTSHGAEFSGFVQWNRKQSIGFDELTGKTENGEMSLRFDEIASIARESGSSIRVNKEDGSEVVLAGTRDAGENNHGVYVDDVRYGRVLVPFQSFERIDFNHETSPVAPSYTDFPPGRPLMGTVTSNSGRRLAGRIVYDLDESETTETLDSRFEGVDYTIPFGLIVSIELPDARQEAGATARIVLHNGEVVQLGLRGDLSSDNAGMLVFPNDSGTPDYLRWAEVKRVVLEDLESD